MSRPNDHSASRTAPIFCYVTDRRSLSLATSSDSITLLLQRIDAALSAGVHWIQLREKDLSGRDVVSLARSALDLARSRNASTRMFVNNRMDVALASGAGGVHLGENALPVADAVRLRDEFFSRDSRPPDFLIGMSCHSLGAALGAARSGADYIYFGPIFDTPSKVMYGPPQGLDLLARICGAVQIPVIAIGGITASNASDCLSAGAAGIAAIRLFQDATDFASLTVRLSSLSIPPKFT